MLKKDVLNRIESLLGSVEDGEERSEAGVRGDLTHCKIAGIPTEFGDFETVTCGTVLLADAESSL